MNFLRSSSGRSPFSRALQVRSSASMIPQKVLGVQAGVLSALAAVPLLVLAAAWGLDRILQQGHLSMRKGLWLCR